MRSFKRVLLGLLALGMALLLSACGPEEDATDDLLINVEVPFSTTGLLTTPSTIQVTGWFGESVSLNEGEYQVLTRDPVSIGEDVRKLQNRLIELGYLSNEKNASTGNYKRANGRFDAATEQAVKNFEAGYGREMTGVATELMQYYLFSSSARQYAAAVTATPSPTPTPTVAASTYRYLQRGDSGDDVTRLQQRLYDLGYLNYVSGTYDSATETAVRLFGSAYSQDTNGNATIEMQRALFSSSAKSYQQMIAAITPTPTVSPTPDPMSGYTTLREGDKGTAVTNLQKRLRELGYMRSKADGIYGDRTVEAVKLFEAAYGRPETGIATAALQMYLYSDDALRYGTVTPTPAFTATPTPAPSYSTLSYGSSGDEVVRLQQRLIELGYLSGGADGEYGGMTRSAIMAFEQAHGYTATGVATAALQAFLFSGSAIPNVTATPAPTASGYQELSLGSSGDAVSRLQGRLNELGYYYGAISGYFDSATQQAVMLFENAYGRNRTGIATSALQTYLYSSSARANVTATPTPSYSSLQKGDKGDEVTRLQNRLSELGYLSGTIDGYFGEGTEQAVKLFEAAYGRTQTGVATSELQVYLYSSSAKANTSGNVAVSYSTLKSGDSGTAVTNLQNRLISLGYMAGSASGKYDNRTVNAVKSFQKLMGLTVNGIASSDLQQKLFASGAKNYSNEKVVSVNKLAQVKTATGVYASFYDESATMTLPKGTQLTVLRTRGIWAEVQNAAGNVGYVMLSDLEYVSSTSTATPSPTPTTARVAVNKSAYINQNSVTVYQSASTSSKKLGTLNQGQAVVWVSTSGDWAEIRNASGTVTGYVKTSQLSLSSPSAGGYSTLSYGSTGDSVKNLQARLKELGYHYGDVGGNYLTRTTEAVRLFQQEIGLTSDGVATPSLQDLLFSAYAPTYKTYSRTQKSYTDMYSGRSDSAVRELQNRLIELGYLSSASGKYDSATVKAVTQVQKKLGLNDTSGIATKELQAFLFKCGNVIKK